MKKLLCIILALVLSVSLWGCEKKQDTLFYYPRAEIQYGASDGVIAPEVRDLSGMENDLDYLLKLYLEGPISQELRSPFPIGTALVSIIQEDSAIALTFSEPFTQLENMDYTIACACVASTCFSLTDAQTVTIQAGDTEMTLTRENLALMDQAAESIPE